MALGPGKYDDLCTYVREQSGAAGAAVIVFGPKGMGFSVQASPQDMILLSKALKNIVGIIDQDIAKDLKELEHKCPACQSELKKDIVPSHQWCSKCELSWPQSET